MSETIRHGHARRGKASKAYAVWANMLTRCRNPNSTNWKNYGERGILVCKRWLTFDNFLSDMGEPPPSQTLDRIDNDGNYEPTNCRWTTRREQVFNRSNALYITLCGERLPAIKACEKFGINYNAFKIRRSRYRLTPIEAFLSQLERI